MSDYLYIYISPSPGPGPGGSPGPGPGNGRPPVGEDGFGAASWAIGVALIFLWFPVGLFFTIAHSTGHDFLGNFLRGLFGGSGKAGQGNYTSPSQTRRAQNQAYTTPGQVKRAPVQGERFPGVRRADAGATLKTVFGWILTGFGALATMGTIFDGSGVWRLLSAIAIILGGGALVLSGAMGRRKEAKFRRCLTISGDRGVVDMKRLAKTLGVDLEEADKTITEMVDRGYYGEKAYIDHERCLLVIDVEDMRDVYRREDEARAAAAAAKEKAESDEAKARMTEYERYIAQIEQADVDIEDEAMSAKIQTMKSLTAAIFREVEAHPEKRSQIDRFMNYYLPTTLKLLESYARIEDYGVAGENMDKAKADIERIADTLVEGYKKQLDKLYRAEAMDIAGDVSVIENMLKRDGLSGKSDFGTPMGGH